MSCNRWMSNTTSKKQIRAIIIGPPGSGKGTISERIVKEFNLSHLSSGDALRNHIRNKTDLGKQIAAVVASGQLVSTNLMAPLIDYELNKVNPGKGWLLDGYPRNVEQATLLAKSVSPNMVIHLDVPFATIIDRVKHRYIHDASGRVYNLDFNPPKVPVIWFLEIIQNVHSKYVEVLISSMVSG